MNAILLISLIVFIVLPMICSALFVVARVAAVHKMESAHQAETTHAEVIYPASPSLVAC